LNPRVRTIPSGPAPASSPGKEQLAAEQVLFPFRKALEDVAQQAGGTTPGATSSARRSCGRASCTSCGWSSCRAACGPGCGRRSGGTIRPGARPGEGRKHVIKRVHLCDCTRNIAALRASVARNLRRQLVQRNEVLSISGSPRRALFRARATALPDWLFSRVLPCSCPSLSGPSLRMLSSPPLSLRRGFLCRCNAARRLLDDL
jgi:hypothetical protein